MYKQNPTPQPELSPVQNSLWISPSTPPLYWSKPMLEQIQGRSHSPIGNTPEEKLENIAGELAFYCHVDLPARKIIETAAVATKFRGYESILPGKDLAKIGLVSSVASGICGGVHATASALCLEMALGMKPPPLGIQVRNLLLSCQYLNDNTLHLFVLAGPDYSETVVRATNPEIWQRAQQVKTQFTDIHGFQYIADIMRALNKPDGALYQEALEMVRIARRAYAILGGKYPHSESIVPGGVSFLPTGETLDAFNEKLRPFYDFSKKTIALWNDLFDFLLRENPAYADVGRTSANMVDFGQWDHHQYYDATYTHCDLWGDHRWSTPGAVIDGKLITTQLSELNTGLEEFVEHSFYQPWQQHPFLHDPNGNPLSLHHPWNKKIRPIAGNQPSAQAYSWGTTMTWRRHTFEVGAYARIYISALAQKIPPSAYIESTGHSLKLRLPKADLPEQTVEWIVPPLWNAFERNRARAYALAFNQMVTLENYRIARDLILANETGTRSPMKPTPSGDCLGVGLWGAGRGFLAHWATLKDGVIDNYQLAIPSRVNSSPRTPWGTPGALEQAVLNTPILETAFQGEDDFQGIDIQRGLQSFDPCMKTTAHILIQGKDRVLDRVIDTRFPI
jgi:hydrogenase large subunit